MLLLLLLLLLHVGVPNRKLFLWNLGGCKKASSLMPIFFYNRQ
jgi:hypothetical protein